jgi:TRAP-type mannitol/chloroaromatic compound transport system permease large subunit
VPALDQDAHIYRGIIPFVFIQLVMVLILVMAPGLVTWLPNLSR